MIWIVVIVLGLACVAIAYALFTLSGGGILALAAVLAVGLAAYAAQGRPDLPGAPAPARVIDTAGAGAMVELRRRAMGSDDGFRARHLLTADAFAQRGQYADAAAFLRGAVRENPKDAEAWVALGNALVEQSDGRLTPAAMLAYRRAQEAAPESLAPDFFIGVALVGRGDLIDARTVWQQALARAPADTQFRGDMEQSLARLDQLLARLAEMENAPQD